MQAQVANNTPEIELAELIAAMQSVENAEAPVVTETIEDDDQDALLAELNNIVAEEVVAVNAPEVIDPVAENGEIDPMLLQEIVAASARAELYAEQENITEVADAETIAEATKAAPKARKARAAGSAPKTPKAPRGDLSALPDAVFQVDTAAPADPSVKAAVLAKRPLQVKIAEKFDNLFQAINAGREPSRYVVTAFKLLKAKGTFTTTDLVNAFKAEGLVDGTARSQTGQIMVLFDAVGVAKRSGQTLVANSNSAIATKLEAIVA